MERTLQRYAIQDANDTTVALIEHPKCRPANRVVAALQNRGFFRGDLSYRLVMESGNERYSFVTDSRRIAISKFYSVVSVALEAKAYDAQRAISFHFTDSAHIARLASRL